MKDKIISIIIIVVIGFSIVGGVYLGINGFAGLGFCMAIFGVATFIFNVPVREIFKKNKNDSLG